VRGARDKARSLNFRAISSGDLINDSHGIELEVTNRALWWGLTGVFTGRSGRICSRISIGSDPFRNGIRKRRGTFTHTRTFLEIAGEELGIIEE